MALTLIQLISYYWDLTFKTEVLWNGRRGGCGVNIPMCKTYVYGVHKDRSREHKMEGVKFLGESIVKSLLGG